MSPVDENDVTEMWREVRKDQQAKRASNREASAQILRDAGVPFVEKNDGAHLIVTVPGRQPIDFWPGTGLWRVHASSKRDRGVRSLLRWLGKESR